jgi:hypothetical protein
MQVAYGVGRRRAFEDGTLREAAPFYDEALGEIIVHLEKQENLAKLPALFFEKFIGSFDLLFEVLGDGLLASYLLGRDQVSEVNDQVEFAEEDFFKFDVAPTKAIEYFRRKKVVTRKEFDDLRDEARASAFTVGGIYRDDVLEGFKTEIARALEEGTPQRETIKRFREILDGASQAQLGAFHLETIFDKTFECHPISPLHLEVLFRKNMRAAYHCGKVGLKKLLASL